MSAASQIADAIVLALAGQATSVVKRKKPKLPPGKGLAAGESAIAVCVQEEGAVEKTSADKVLVKYPVLVAYITPGGQLTADDEGIRTKRETVRGELAAYGTYSTVDNFNDVNVTGGMTFDDTAANAAALNYSVIRAVVETHEDRV